MEILEHFQIPCPSCWVGEGHRKRTVSLSAEARFVRARDLPAMSRQTIGEIARELGFANPFYFTLRCKKHTGESPRAFRQRTTRK